MNDNNQQPDEERHVRAYGHILSGIKKFITHTEDEISKQFNHALENAKKTGSELNEFTHEEVDLIGEYIKRDIHDAAHYISETGTELSDWLRFDTQLIEAKLLELMNLAVDSSRVELAQLTEKARRESIWSSGETTGPGTLRCTQCQNTVQFHQIGIIPKCPVCNNDQFQRFSKS